MSNKSANNFWTMRFSKMVKIRKIFLKKMVPKLQKLLKMGEYCLKLVNFSHKKSNKKNWLRQIWEISLGTGQGLSNMAWHDLRNYPPPIWLLLIVHNTKHHTILNTLLCTVPYTTLYTLKYTVPYIKKETNTKFTGWNSLIFGQIFPLSL